MGRNPDRGRIGTIHKAQLWRYFPQMIATTLVVVALPVLAVTALRDRGVVSGIVPLLFAGLVVSLAVSSLGAAIWKSRPGSGDILFGDLIVWGFIRRWRVDRRLSSAAQLLGVDGHGRGGEASDLTPAVKAELLEQLAGALEARDPYTHGHSRRVARHATTMAKRLGLPREEVAKIRTAAAIHDVGKVETPPEVLAKPGALSDEEFTVIKRHPVAGARMSTVLKDPELTDMVLYHHERLDGGGYPVGLRGDQIPMGARIIAVADTFDAITSARPYRSAKAHKKALDILRAESGSQLDPDAVEAFRSYYSGLRPMVFWGILVSLPQRLFAGILDELGSGVTSASKVMAATTATVVAGTAAAHAVDLPHSTSNRVGDKPAKVSYASQPGAPSQSGKSSPDSASGPALSHGSGPRASTPGSGASSGDGAGDRGTANPSPGSSSGSAGDSASGGNSSDTGGRSDSGSTSTGADSGSGSGSSDGDAGSHITLPIVGGDSGGGGVHINLPIVGGGDSGSGSGSGGSGIKLPIVGGGNSGSGGGVHIKLPIVGG